MPTLNKWKKVRLAQKRLAAIQLYIRHFCLYRDNADNLDSKWHLLHNYALVRMSIIDAGAMETLYGRETLSALFYVVGGFSHDIVYDSVLNQLIKAEGYYYTTVKNLDLLVPWNKNNQKTEIVVKNEFNAPVGAVTNGNKNNVSVNQNIGSVESNLIQQLRQGIQGNEKISPQQKQEAMEQIELIENSHGKTGLVRACTNELQRVLVSVGESSLIGMVHEIGRLLTGG